VVLFFSTFPYSSPLVFFAGPPVVDFEASKVDRTNRVVLTQLHFSLSWPSKNLFTLFFLSS